MYAYEKIAELIIALAIRNKYRVSLRDSKNLTGPPTHTHKSKNTKNMM